MAQPLFSQLPTQVLNKLGRGNIKKTRSGAKFYADEVIEEIDLESDDEKAPVEETVTPKSDSNAESTIIDVEESPTKSAKKRLKYSDEVPTSSNNQVTSNNKLSDAMVQTDDFGINKRDASTQTNESLLNRPLNKSDYENHRDQGAAHFGDSYKPMYSIPKRLGKDVPPLKIGLTLRGRKRKVFYPGEDD